jgi:4-carboxymuconolactone decarboxylase
MSQRPLVLDERSLTQEQQVVFDRIRSGPRGVVEGPLRVWLQSPALAEHAQSLGAFCRYGTRLPSRLSELAILIAGAHWRAGFEWHVHAPIAAREGVGADVIEALRLGHAPHLAKDDETAIYNFCTELLVSKQVSDATYASAIGLFEVAGVVELVGILGYYTFICMTINTFRVPIPEGAIEPFSGDAERGISPAVA